MLFLNLPFAIRPGLTGSSVNKNVKQCKLGLAKVAMLDGRDTIASLADLFSEKLYWPKRLHLLSHKNSDWALIGIVYVIESIWMTILFDLRQYGLTYKAEPFGLT